MNRWAEHFEEFLNILTPSNPPDIEQTNSDLPINCDKPIREEIKRAIKMTRKEKAAGPDDIPTEALLADLDASVEMLYPLCEKI